MKFIVTPEIFEKLPTMYVGVVVAHGINNQRDYPVIDQLLENTNTRPRKSSMALTSRRVQRSSPTVRPFAALASTQTNTPARLSPCSSGCQRVNSYLTSTL